MNVSINHKIFIRYVIFAFTALFILFISCKSDKIKESKSLKDAKLTMKEKLSGVCIWDGIAIREKPSRNALLISTLNQGESFYYLNTHAIDSSHRNQKYLNIEFFILLIYDFNFICT